METESTTHLPNIDIRTVLINIRVIRIKHRRVNSMRTSDRIARILLLNYIRRLTILSVRSQANGGTRLEVTARRVDSVCVNSCELVGGGVVRGGDAVADVPVDDGVGAYAVCC